MSLKDVRHSVWLLFVTYFKVLFNPEKPDVGEAGDAVVTSLLEGRFGLAPETSPRTPWVNNLVRTHN